MKINTNINAIRANLNLNSVQKKFADSTNRLSSGYRINKAADDAAGLAISQKMHAQIRGLHRASQNGSDGVSFIQTAEGALTEIESMLQRCRELSVQAANETNTIEDKKALQREIDSLRDEIDRLSSQTEYNTMSLLDGTCCRQSSCDNVGVSLVSASDDVPLTTYKFSVDQEATQATMTTAGINFKPDDVVTKDDEGSIQINGEIIKVKQGETYQDVYATIRDCCEMMNIDVVPVGNDGKECDLSDAVNLSFTSVLYGASQKIQITTDNANLAAKLGVNGAQEVQGQDAKVTLDTSSGFSNTATIFIDGGRVEVSDRDGFNMIFDVSEAAAGSTANMTMLDAGYVAIQIGANEGQTMSFTLDDMSADALGVGSGSVDLSTQDKAKTATTTIDAAIKKVSKARGQMGAVQNRLEHTINNLDTASENLQTAESRIRDTDMAEEMVNYSKNSILAQAGQSMLAQANQANQGVLTLLQ